MQQTVLTSSGAPGAPAIVVRSFEAEGPAPAQASIVITRSATKLPAAEPIPPRAPWERLCEMTMAMLGPGDTINPSTATANSRSVGRVGILVRRNAFGCGGGHYSLDSDFALVSNTTSSGRIRT